MSTKSTLKHKKGTALSGRARVARFGSTAMPPARATSGFTLVELSIVLIVLGVLTAVAIPNYITMTIRSKESKVKENCHCVQLVVELHATGTNGVYPAANEASIVANLVPLFSGAQRLRNPFTNVRTEPVAGVAATPGQTGYQVNAPMGINIGYTLTGFGKTAIVITQSGGE